MILKCDLVAKAIRNFLSGLPCRTISSVTDESLSVISNNFETMNQLKQCDLVTDIAPFGGGKANVDN